MHLGLLFEVVYYETPQISVFLCEFHSDVTDPENFWKTVTCKS